MHSKKTEKIVIFSILVIAAFFRLYQLDSIPPGIYPDEAINANDALKVLDSDKPQVFYPDNNGREGLFINLTALSFKIFGANIWSFKLIAVLAGIIGVGALYLLAKEMFNWQIGAMSSFLMAISFWHVNFSRIHFRAILAPMLITFMFYFLWKALKGKHILNFLWSGIFLGLGFYTYIAFRITPLILILGLLAYWQFIKKDFNREQYTHARKHIFHGLILLFITAALIALPLGAYYWVHPDDFLGRTSQISVFSSDQFWKQLGTNILQTLGIFNFEGDYNWRHNFSGRPILLWPVGVLFIAGLFRNILKFFKHRKDHGHFSAIHTILLSWFFIGLSPVFLSSEGLPHTLRAILTAPVVFLFAGEGAWWFFSWLKNWYSARDKHLHEAVLVSSLVMIIFLGSLGLAEYKKYFIDWAQNPNTASAFNQNYVKIGKEINKLPKTAHKYIVVHARGVLVDGIPMPAQTVMFITGTYSKERQQQKNVFYLSPEEFLKQRTAITGRDGIVFELR
ncbi:MAG: glycosyltransferase family 39 protein [bacterium]|nr:glycosyltransferase family 39 protein [bacterium]